MGCCFSKTGSLKSDGSADVPSADRNASDKRATYGTSEGPIASEPPRTVVPPTADPQQLRTITDVSQLTALIEYNDRLLCQIKGVEPPSPGISGSGDSKLVRGHIAVASNLLENSIPAEPGRLPRTENLASMELGKLVTDSMRGLGQLHWTAFGFSVIAYVLERFDKVSSNRNECTKLLDSMTAMAKRLMKLNEIMPEDREWLNRAVQTIVEGSIVCCCHMEHGNLTRYWFAATMKERLEETRHTIQQVYDEVNRLILMDIQKRVPHRVAQLQSELLKFEPVGIEDQAAQVTQLLDMNGTEPALAVIIYGFGGVGKTTLANCVIKNLTLPGFQLSSVRIEEKSLDIKTLQERIIFELQERTVDLKDDDQGRIELTKVLKTQWSFLLVDNVTKKEHIDKLLPKDLSDGNQRLRILITSRSNNVKEELTIAHREHRVEPLSDDSAKKLLRSTIFGSDGTITPHNNGLIDRLAVACGGIPLLLQVYGKYLRGHGSDAAYYKGALDSLLTGEYGNFNNGQDLSSIILHVYHQMKDKEAFRDICTILHGLQWDVVSSTVGDMQLKTLQGGALVKNVSNKVIVHDVLRNMGLKESKGTRLHNLAEFKAILDDKEKLRQLRGLWLADNESLFNLDVTDINRMSDSLRILALGNWIKIDGQSGKTFAQLRFLQVGDLALFPFKEKSQFKELRVFHSNIMVSENLSKTLPLTLEQVRLIAPPDETAAVLPQGFWKTIKNMEHLQKFEFIDFKGVDLIPEEFMFPSPLVELDVTGCSKLRKLPQGMGRLTTLTRITLNGCKNLEALPEDLCKLNSLKWLSMRKCSSLTALPANIGQLSSLREFDLTECIKLGRLPESFKSLTSLAEVRLTGCESLQNLPGTVKIFSASALYPSFTLKGLEGLVQIPDQVIGNLSSLAELELRSCNSLRSLPESIGSLSSLKNLTLQSCSSLKSLPDSIGNLSSLRHLTLGSCSSLKCLPKGTGSLSSLSVLTLRFCISLRNLPECIGNLRVLTELTLRSCTSLTSLPKGFGNLKSLRNLSLHSCHNLRTLSDDFECLSSLSNLKIIDCEVLEGVTMQKLVKLNRVLEVPITGSLKLIQQWEAEEYPLVVKTSANRSAVPEDYQRAASVAFFGGQSRLVDCDGRCMLSSDLIHSGSVAFVVAHRKISEPQWVRKTMERVASLKSQIIYVEADEDCDEESIREFLRLLPPGSRAIPSTDVRTRSLLNKAIYSVRGACGIQSKENIHDDKDQQCFIRSLIAIADVKSNDNGRKCLALCSMAEPPEFSFRKVQISKSTSLQRIGSHTDEGEQTSENERAKNMLPQSRSAGQETSNFKQFVKEMTSQGIHYFITHDGEKIELGNLRGRFDLLFVVHCNRIVLELFKMKQMYEDLQHKSSATLFAWIPKFHRKLYGRELYGVGCYERARLKYQWLTTVPDPTLCRSCDVDAIAIYDGQGRMIKIRDVETSDMVLMWGVEAFPFNNEKIDELKKKELTNMQQCQSSLEFVLGDSVFLNCQGKVVKKESMRGKIILLYQTRLADLQFRWKLATMYKILKNHELDNFEIVHVWNINVEDEDQEVVHDSDHHLFSVVEKSQNKVEEMPWLRLSLSDLVKSHHRIKWLCSKSNVFLAKDPKWPTIKTLASCLNDKDVNERLLVIDANGEVATSEGEEIIGALTSDNDALKNKVIECMKNGKCEDMRKALRVLE